MDNVLMPYEEFLRIHAKPVNTSLSHASALRSRCVHDNLLEAVVGKNIDFTHLLIDSALAYSSFADTTSKACCSHGLILSSNSPRSALLSVTL